MSLPPRFLLVSHPNERLNRYRTVFNEHDIAHDWIINLTDLKVHLTQSQYHGVFIDIPSRLQSSVDDKEWSQELENYFPCVGINCNMMNNNIVVSSKKHLGCSLEDFVSEAGKGSPRKIRLHDRYEVHLNLSFSFEGRMINSNSLNLSLGGCFILGSAMPDIGESLSLNIQELSDSPVEAKVIWHRPWGETQHLCGFGVAFEQPLKGFSKTVEGSIKVVSM